MFLHKNFAYLPLAAIACAGWSLIQVSLSLIKYFAKPPVVHSFFLPLWIFPNLTTLVEKASTITVAFFPITSLKV